MYTEEKAKEKWCPLRVSLTGQTCCGKGCMMWRWSRAKETQAYLDAVQKRMGEQAKPNFNKASQEVFAEFGTSFEKTEGYCGLAGKPE